MLVNWDDPDMIPTLKSTRSIRVHLTDGEIVRGVFKRYTRGREVLVISSKEALLAYPKGIPDKKIAFIVPMFADSRENLGSYVQDGDEGVG